MDRLSSLLFLCLIAVGGHAQSGADYYFEQGNQAYRDSDFNTALDWYGRIPQSGYASAAVYYNMGNCYFRLNQIGSAILYYEKALRLNPGDQEIEANLELARARTVDRIEPLPSFFLFDWWDTVKTSMTPNQLSVLLLVGYLLFMGLWITMLFLRERFRKFLIYSLAAIGFLTLFSSYLLITQIRAEDRSAEAIVLATSANVHSAPDAGSTDMFVLHEGTKVTMTDPRGEWARVTLIDGKTGWLRVSDLGKI